MSHGAATLHHDVGKRIARTARNVGERAITPPILAMLVKDLYAIDGTARASVVFADRVRACGPRAALDDVPRLLARIDALEPDVRAGADAAVREAIALALDVSDRIAALLVREAGR